MISFGEMKGEGRVEIIKQFLCFTTFMKCPAINLRSEEFIKKQ